MAAEHEFRRIEVTAAARQADAFDRIADSLAVLVEFFTTPPISFQEKQRMDEALKRFDGTRHR